jgi:hypothetical protein
MAIVYELRRNKFYRVKEPPTRYARLRGQVPSRKNEKPLYTKGRIRAENVEKTK